MNPIVRVFFSYGWGIFEASHRGMLSFNNSLNMLQLRIQKPQAPFDQIPTQDEFNSYLIWFTNRKFHYECDKDHACGSGIWGAQVEDEEGPEGIEGEETTSEEDWSEHQDNSHHCEVFVAFLV